MAETHYAWSRIRAGGEVEAVTDPIGRERKVVSSRNIIMPGEPVSAKDVGGQETFDQMVEAGSIRPYPYPKDLSLTSTESPVNFLRRQLREAAEAELSEEQQLMLATGQGAVVTDEDLVAAQPGTAKEIKKTSGTE